MNSSAVKLHMQTLWRRAGLSSEVGPTIFRKAAVTQTNIKAPEHKKQLATKMNHSEATASKNYFLFDKAVAGKTVSKMMVMPG